MYSCYVKLVSRLKALCVAVIGGAKKGKSGGKIVLESEADFEKIFS